MNKPRRIARLQIDFDTKAELDKFVTEAVDCQILEPSDVREVDELDQGEVARYKLERPAQR
jgi:hypothetical protein